MEEMDPSENPDTGKGFLMKRKDFLGVDELADSHPNRTYYYRKNYYIDDCIHTCTKKIQNDPTDIKALSLRGSSYFKKKEYAEAIQDFTQLLQYNPTDIDAIYLRGLSLSKIGDHTKAIGDLSVVLERNPDNVNAAFARAACFNTIGLFSRAIEDYNFALMKDQSFNEGQNPRDNRLRSYSGSSSPYVSFPSDNMNSSNNSYSNPNNPVNNSFLDSPYKDVVFAPVANTDIDASFVRNSNNKPIAETQQMTEDSYAVAVDSTERLKGEKEIVKIFKPKPPTSQPMKYPVPIDMNASTTTALPGSPMSIKSSGSINRTLALLPPPLETSNSASTYNTSATQSPNASSRVKPTMIPLQPFITSTKTGPIGGDNTKQSQGPVRSKSPAKVPSSPKSSLTNANASIVDEIHSRGYNLRRQGDYNGAIFEYTNALSYDPTHFKALFNRGFAYDKLEKFDLAVADYTAAINVAPDNAYAYYNRGISHDRMGKLEEAYTDFTKAIKLQTGNADFHHNRAFCLRKMDRLEEAIQDYTTSLIISPHHFKALFNRSYCHDRIGKLKAALEDINAALSLQPKHLGCLTNRALIYERMEQYQDAIDDYTKALENGGYQLPIFNSRAKLYAKMNRFDMAIADLNAAQQLSPNNIGLLFSRAMSYKSLEDYQNAIKDFTNVISIDKEQLLCYTNRGFCWRKLEEFEKAIDDYSEVIKRSPEDIRAYNNRAFVYAKLDKFEAAISDYSNVIRIDPYNAHAYHNRGISFDKIGQFDLAIADFTKVMELEANQAGQLTPPTPQTTSASGNRLATPLQASPYGNNSPLKSAIKAPLQSMKVTPTGSPKQTPTIRNPYSLPDDNIETAVPPSSAKDDSVRSPKRIIRNNGNLLSNLKSYAMGGKDNESAVSIRKSAQILEPKPLESKQAPSTDPKDDGDSTNSVEDRFASATSLLSKFTAPSAHTAKMPPRLHRVPIPKPASSYVSANVSDASVTNPSDDIKSPGYFSYRTGVGGINSFKKPEIDKNHINDASVSSSQSPTVTSTSSHGSNDGLYERLKRPVLSLPAGSYNSNSSATTPILSASSFLNRIGTHDGNTGTVHNKSFGNVNNSGENKKSEKRVTYSSDVIK